MEVAWMRNHRGKMIAAMLVLLLTSGFVLRDNFVQLYMRMNSDALENFALSALADCKGELLSTHYGSWDAMAWKQAGIVEFSTQRSPAFGGIEKGFYYSRNDTPISFQAAGYPLTEDGAGWSWEDPYGNHGYTEQIRPHWFWYKAVL